MRSLMHRDLIFRFSDCFKVTPSRKQEIYFMLLDLTLPYIRNVQTWPFWSRLRFGNVLAECELVLDLHRKLFDPELKKRDIWWLENRAAVFRQVRSRRPFGQSKAILRLLDELSEIASQRSGKHTDGNPDLPFIASESRKQEIYLTVFDLALPLIRDVQTWPPWKRLFFGNVFAESELVHNLHPLIFIPEFKDRDIWWLETQAAIFRKARSRKPFGRSEDILRLIDELWKITSLDQKPRKGE